MTEEQINIKGVTESEWRELLTLEYVLTWNYSDNNKRDTKRYMNLSHKHWDFGFAFDTKEYYKRIFHHNYKA